MLGHDKSVPKYEMACTRNRLTASSLFCKKAVQYEENKNGSRGLRRSRKKKVYDSHSEPRIHDFPVTKEAFLVHVIMASLHNAPHCEAGKFVVTALWKGVQCIPGQQTRCLGIWSVPTVLLLRTVKT